MDKPSTGNMQIASEDCISDEAETPLLYVHDSRPIRLTTKTTSVWAYKNLLCHYSGDFTRKLDGKVIDSKFKLSFPNEDESTLRCFVTWLCCRQINDIKETAAGNTEPQDAAAKSELKLCKVWVFAETHQIPLLKLDCLLAIHQLIGETWKLDNDVVKYVYDKTPSGCALRQLFVEKYAAIAQADVIGWEYWRQHKGLTDFVFDLATSFARIADSGGRPKDARELWQSTDIKHLTADAATDSTRSVNSIEGCNIEQLLSGWSARPQKDAQYKSVNPASEPPRAQRAHPTDQMDLKQSGTKDGKYENSDERETLLVSSKPTIKTEACPVSKGPYSVNPVKREEPADNAPVDLSKRRKIEHGGSVDSAGSMQPPPLGRFQRPQFVISRKGSGNIKKER